MHRAADKKTLNNSSRKRVATEWPESADKVEGGLHENVVECNLFDIKGEEARPVVVQLSGVADRCGERVIYVRQVSSAAGHQKNSSR